MRSRGQNRDGEMRVHSWWFYLSLVLLMTSTMGLILHFMKPQLNRLGVPADESQGWLLFLATTVLTCIALMKLEERTYYIIPKTEENQHLTKSIDNGLIPGFEMETHGERRLFVLRRLPRDMTISGTCLAYVHRGCLPRLFGRRTKWIESLECPDKASWWRIASTVDSTLLSQWRPADLLTRLKLRLQDEHGDCIGWLGLDEAFDVLGQYRTIWEMRRAELDRKEREADLQRELEYCLTVLLALTEANVSGFARRLVGAAFLGLPGALTGTDLYQRCREKAGERLRILTERADAVRAARRRPAVTKPAEAAAS